MGDLLVKSVIEGKLLEIGRHFSNSNQDSRRESLQIACKNSSVATARLLLELGCPASFQLFFQAIARGSADIVKVFVEAGIDSREYHHESICIAAQYGHVGLLEYFRNLGCNPRIGSAAACVNAKDKDSSHTEEFCKMMDKKITEYWGKPSGTSYLEIIKRTKFEPIADLVDEPLKRALYGSHLEAVKYLVEVCGADLHQQCRDGLLCAARNNRLDTYEYLLNSYKKFGYTDVKDVVNESFFLAYKFCDGTRDLIEYLSTVS